MVRTSLIHKRAHHRPDPGHPLAGLALAAVVALAAGCPAAGDEIRPPREQFVFPVSMAVSPDESVLFVGNANSELRYDSGSVQVVDLDAVDQMLAPWIQDAQVPADDDPAIDDPECEPDPALPSVLQCNEGKVIDPTAGVRIGNFATELGVQELSSGDLRVIVGVRGDPSITWIDYSVADRELSCEGSQEVPLCDGANRLLFLQNDVELPKLTSEPFGMYVDSANGYALVTHLSFATVTLVDLPTDPGRTPIIADALGGLFDVDPDTGTRSAVGVAGRLPGTPDNLVYVTSRSQDLVQVVHVDRPASPDLLPRIVPADFFFLNGVNPGDDSRGIAFNSDGTRAYVVNRDPPMLHVLDTSLDATGFPVNQPLGFVELCRDSSSIAVADVGRGDRIYTTCFPDGQVWVMDPTTDRLDAIIAVGRGPHALTVAPDRKRLYVANFLEDTIAVVDLTPGAPTENSVVMRLGRPRQSGDE